MSLKIKHLSLFSSPYTCLSISLYIYEERERERQRERLERGFGIPSFLIWWPPPSLVRWRWPAPSLLRGGERSISFISFSLPTYIYVRVSLHIERKDGERGWHPILLVPVTLHISCKMEVASPSLLSRRRVPMPISFEEEVAIYKVSLLSSTCYAQCISTASDEQQLCILYNAVAILVQCQSQVVVRWVLSQRINTI